MSLILLNFVCTGQQIIQKQYQGPSEKYARSHIEYKKGQNVRIVFYNTENLYDTKDDSLKMDDDFTSTGTMHWTYRKMEEKLNHLAKTILAIGEWDPPAIIGLCEVENRYVLNKMVFNTPLQNFHYRVIHKDSPDNRGIDVALLYRPEKFTPVSTRFIPVNFPFDTSGRTRDILLVKGVVFHSDTIYLFINHWPSRRGGYIESQPRRNYVAGLVRKQVDSIFALNPLSNIILTGDFNDEPDKESLLNIMKAHPDTLGDEKYRLINLMSPLAERWNKGTIKYQGQWSIFDQFIVSHVMVQGKSGLMTSFSDAHIFRAGFLVEEDERNFGVKLKRTYNGRRYTGGFSDHLPIYLDVWKKK